MAKSQYVKAGDVAASSTPPLPASPVKAGYDRRFPSTGEYYRKAREAEDLAIGRNTKGKLDSYARDFGEQGGSIPRRLTSDTRAPSVDMSEVRKGRRQMRRMDIRDRAIRSRSTR